MQAAQKTSVSPSYISEIFYNKGGKHDESYWYLLNAADSFDDI